MWWRLLFLFPVLHGGITPVRAQTGPCLIVVHGTFEEGTRTRQAEISGNPTGIRIVRHGKGQKEKDHADRTTVRYDVNWPEPCTYQLTNRRTKRGMPQHVWADTDTITIRITEVREDGYDYERTTNFSADTLGGVMQRVVPVPHGGVISLGF